MKQSTASGPITLTGKAAKPSAHIDEAAGTAPWRPTSALINVDGVEPKVNLVPVVAASAGSPKVRSVASELPPAA